MSMTLTEIRTYARDYLDVDSNDISDTLINQWVKEGFNRIVKQLQDWRGYEEFADVETSADVETYTIGFAGEYAQIYGPSGPIPRYAQAEAEGRFRTGVSPADTGEPVAYSISGSSVTFYPTPNDTYQYTVRGFRNPTDPLTGGGSSTPDLPNDQCFNVLLDFVVAQANVQQDDFEKAGWFQKQFTDGLKQLSSVDASAPLYQPLVVNGHRIAGDYGSPEQINWPNNFPAW